MGLTTFNRYRKNKKEEGEKPSSKPDENKGKKKKNDTTHKDTRA